MNALSLIILSCRNTVKIVKLCYFVCVKTGPLTIPMYLLLTTTQCIGL